MPYNGIQTIVICQDYFWASLLIERFIRGSEVVFRGRCITICVQSSVITMCFLVLSRIITPLLLVITMLQCSILQCCNNVVQWGSFLVNYTCDFGNYFFTEHYSSCFIEQSWWRLNFYLRIIQPSKPELLSSRQNHDENGESVQSSRKRKKSSPMLLFNEKTRKATNEFRSTSKLWFSTFGLLQLQWKRWKWRLRRENAFNSFHFCSGGIKAGSDGAEKTERDGERTRWSYQVFVISFHVQLLGHKPL